MINQKATTTGLAALAFLLLTAASVIAATGYVIPGVRSSDEVVDYEGVSEASGEAIEPIPGEEGEIKLPVPPQASEYEGGPLSDLASKLHDIVGEGATIVSTNGDPSVQWEFVEFKLADGNFLTVNVSHLDAVERPGEFIEPDWELSEIGGYSAAFAPGDDTFADVWVLTESYQFGVALSSPPREHLDLSAAAAKEIISAYALDIANQLG